MNRKEAFAQLIEKRGWYKNLNISVTTANTHKRRFKKGETVSLEFIGRALEAAGYELKVEEHWENLKL